MSENKRSFWSSIPGVVTGVAGLLTGIVGLVTVLIQLDVMGGDNSSDGTGATATTVAGAGTTAVGGAGATPTTEVPRFTVSPTTLDFKAADPREKEVTVKNESSAALLTLSLPRISGKDAGRFTASSGACSALRAGESCKLRVTFAPAGPLASYEAKLEVTATGARVEEVRLTGSTLLG